MNAEDTRIYKIYKVKNVQKTSRGGENFLSVLKLWKESLKSGAVENTDVENIDSDNIKVAPKRYMKDINASFTVKTTAEIIDAGKITQEIKEDKKDEQKEEDKIFFDSLKAMKPNDIVLNEVAKNVKKAQVDLLRYFVLLISVAIFVYAGYNIVEQLYSYVQAARKNDELRQSFYETENLQDAQYLKKTKANVPIQDILVLQKQVGIPAVQADVSDGVMDVDKSRRNMQKLIDRNPDLYCWLKVSYTTIDYPVVQAKDNEFYLYNDFDKRSSSSGAIFADYHNSRNIMDNRHVVMYGHNMLNNSIFQPLIKFGNDVNLFKNSIIELITEDAIYYYEVFSACEEDPYSGYIQTEFATDEEYVAFLNEMKERSVFQKNIVLDENSKIITLSTCVNDVKRDWRFAVRGVLIDVK